MISLLPEIMLKIFLTADQLTLLDSNLGTTRKLIKSNLKQKKSKKQSGAPTQPLPSIPAQNRAFILKFLTTLPSLYASIASEESLNLDILSLAKLISVIQSPKLLTNVLRLTILSIPETDQAQELLMTYLKINIQSNSSLFFFLW